MSAQPKATWIALCRYLKVADAGQDIVRITEGEVILDGQRWILST